MTTSAIAIAELLGIAAIALFYLSLNSGTWLITPDSTTYVEGAVSLSRGQGFVEATGQPIAIVPPGASAVYALAALVPSADYRFFNSLTKAIVVGFVTLSYLLIRRTAGRGIAMVATVSLALSPVLVVESTRLLSDILFGVVLALTLWLYPEERLERLTVRSAVGLGILLSSAYLVRTVGLALWLAYVAFIVMTVRRHRWHTVATLSAVFVPVVAVLSVRAAGIDDISYLGLMFSRVPWVADSGVPTLADWFERITTNMVGMAGHAVYVWPTGGPTKLTSILISGLMLLGIAAQLVNRRSRLHLWFLFFYTVAILLTVADPRYVLVIAPLFALLMADGATSITRLVGAPIVGQRVAIAAMMLFVVLPGWLDGYAYARTTRAYLDRSRGVAIVYRRHEAFVEVVRQHLSSLSSADVVATNHSRILRYFLPRHVGVRELPIRQEPEAAFRRIKAAGVTYLYCDKDEDLIWRHTEAVTRAHPSAFRLVTDAPTAAIYQVMNERRE